MRTIITVFFLFLITITTAISAPTVPDVGKSIAIIADETSASLSEEMVKGIQSIRVKISSLKVTIDEFPSFLKQAEHFTLSPYFLDHTLKPILLFFLVLSFGFAARKLFEKQVVLFQKRYITLLEENLLYKKLKIIFFITLFSSSSFIFLMVSQIGISSINIPKSMINFTDYVVIIIFLTVFLRSFSHSLLCPSNESSRLFSLSNDTAYGLYLAIRKSLSLFFFGAVFIGGYHHLELPAQHYYFTKLVVGTIILFAIIKPLFFYRVSITNWINTRSSTLEKLDNPWKKTAMLLRTLKNIWLPIVFVASVTFYVVWAFGPESQFFFLIKSTLFTVLTTMIAIKAVQAHGERFINRKDNKKASISTHSYYHIWTKGHRLLQTLYIFSAAILILSFWNIDFFTWLETPMGTRILVSLLTVSSVILISYFIWLIVNTFLFHYVAKYHGQRGSYAKTITPILQRIAKSIIVIFAFLVALPLFNINVVPFLAFFTFFGVALGMGTQSFMKDLISGFLILAERTVNIGDQVTIRPVEGKVKEINLRTLVLEDADGTIHTIPHSTISVISNSSVQKQS